jgi:hypothetical protein
MEPIHRRIADALNSGGILTPRGGRWHATKFELEVLLICASLSASNRRVPGSASDEHLPGALGPPFRFSERFETGPGLYSGG